MHIIFGDRAAQQFHAVGGNGRREGSLGRRGRVLHAPRCRALGTLEEFQERSPLRRPPTCWDLLFEDTTVESPETGAAFCSGMTLAKSRQKADRNTRKRRKRAKEQHEQNKPKNMQSPYMDVERLRESTRRFLFLFRSLTSPGLFFRAVETSLRVFGRERLVIRKAWPCLGVRLDSAALPFQATGPMLLDVQEGLDIDYQPCIPPLSATSQRQNGP